MRRRLDAVRKRVNIHIGEMVVSKEPLCVRTVVGSCVAVCIFDPVRKIGGINHILLPGSCGDGSCTLHGMSAMELLVKKVLDIGGERADLQAKAFGGAHMLASVSPENGVGKDNIDMAIRFLGQEMIPVVNSDLGGFDARTIYFFTDSGDVWLRRYPVGRTSGIVREETESRESIMKKLGTGLVKAGSKE